MSTPVVRRHVGDFSPEDGSDAASGGGSTTPATTAAATTTATPSTDSVNTNGDPTDVPVDSVERGEALSADGGLSVGGAVGIGIAGAASLLTVGYMTLKAK
eukprot:scaffold4298_cov183-Amphora_coffeaeformis.AAC.4